MATGETQLQLCLYIVVMQLHEIQHKQKARCRAEKQKEWEKQSLHGESSFWLYLFTQVLIQTADEMYGLCH